MALTALDPNAALIVVDLQKGLVGARFVQPIAGVIARSRAPGRTEQRPQTAAFPQDWTDHIRELDRQANDIVATKRTWGAFAGADLERALRTRGATKEIIDLLPTPRAGAVAPQRS